MKIVWNIYSCVVRLIWRYILLTFVIYDQINYCCSFQNRASVLMLLHFLKNHSALRSSMLLIGVRLDALEKLRMLFNALEKFYLPYPMWVSFWRKNWGKFKNFKTWNMDNLSKTCISSPFKPYSNYLRNISPLWVIEVWWFRFRNLYIFCWKMLLNWQNKAKMLW